MAITSSFVLAPDLLMIPADQLTSEVRKRAECGEGDIALTRTRARSPSIVIDPAMANLLEEFRQPKTLIEAVIDYCRRNELDPRETLESAFPILQQLIARQLLVEHNQNNMEPGFPSLPLGGRVGEAQIIGSIQLVDDVEVYRARLVDGTPVAIKMATRTDKEACQMVQREARILNRLGGVVTPNLVSTGTFEQRPYLITEWCQGVSCSRVADEIRVNFENAALELLNLCRNVVHAYRQLHCLGIVHGDVHPRNLLVDKDGKVKIIDFGLARVIEDDNSISCGCRGGVGFFFDPQFAEAQITGRIPGPPTPVGEQYSIGVLLYFLITGQHYLDFSLEEYKVMKQIVSESMLPFAHHRCSPWPGLEGIIETALNKDPARRHASLAVMAAELDSVCIPALSAPIQKINIDAGAASDLLADVLDRVDLTRTIFRDGLSPAPTCSINYGAAGIAYALYRIACVRASPPLLALADAWLHHAMCRAQSKDAFYNAEFDVTPDKVGRTSLYHGLPGLHAVDALISRAMGDTVGHSGAINAFISATQAPSPNIDLTLGQSGILVGAALLLQTLVPTDQESKSSLLILGNRIAQEIAERILVFDDVQASVEVDYFGIAHGWAGIIFALLRWAQATNQCVPGYAHNRLAELAACAEPVGRGLCWRPRSIAADPDPKQQYLPGWCNGSAGFVHLWTLAYEMTGNSGHMLLAERAAWNVWEQPDGIRSLCCGLAGRAYALLNFYKHNGDQKWLERARLLAVRAALRTREENPFYNSLYKGEIGIALLIAELDDPQFASMPMFEADASQFLDVH